MNDEVVPPDMGRVKVSRRRPQLAFSLREPRPGPSLQDVDFVLHVPSLDHCPTPQETKAQSASTLATFLPSDRATGAQLADEASVARPR